MTTKSINTINVGTVHAHSISANSLYGVTTVAGAHTHSWSKSSFEAYQTYEFKLDNGNKINYSFADLTDIVKAHEDIARLTKEFPIVKEAYDKFQTVLKLHK